MNTTDVRTNDASKIASVGTFGMKVEVVVVPVADVDRATEFYGRLGWRLDITPARVRHRSRPGRAGRRRHRGGRDLPHRPDGPVGGPDPERRTYRSQAAFSDPDGNVWLLQEITTRLSGRVDPGATSFGSVRDLASAFRRAEAAHGEHEKRTDERDTNWPDWYATYMVAEQAGTELPT